MTTPQQGAVLGETIRHLLVPMDGSRLAEAVLPAVSELARRCGARVTLLHVLEWAAPATIHGQSHLTGAQAAMEYLTRLRESLVEQGLCVEVHIHSNPERDVAASIVEHAAELGVD